MRAMITDASAAPTLSVSIVVHESALDRLAATLYSLDTALHQAMDQGAIGAAHITLIDNASSKTYQSELTRCVESARAACASKATIILELSADNPGFGTGHNRAQEGRGEDYLLILNPDVELADASLTEGLGCMRDCPGVVAVNPHCSRPDGSREYLCKRFPSVLALVLRGATPAFLHSFFRRELDRYEYRDVDVDGSFPVELLSGACLLCRRSAFDAVGGFDTSYFMYFEDFDLSRRLAPHGELRYLPGMRIVHHGGYAARKGGGHVRWFACSAIRFFQRHGWRWL